VFVLIKLQWNQARWWPGVVRLVMEGIKPAVVPDTVVTLLKAREVNGLIELPPPPQFRRGDRVRVLHGPLAGQVGLFAGMKPRERVAVLLKLLGSSRRVELAGAVVERVRL
jgi:transcriptional antiterminator RfaH